MPDIFDQVTAGGAAKPAGDVFDQVAPATQPAAAPGHIVSQTGPGAVKNAGDIFDQAAAADLNYRAPGQILRPWQQQAQEEIRRAPGLNEAGKQAVIDRWQMQAQGPGVQSPAQSVLPYLAQGVGNAVASNGVGIGLLGAAPSHIPDSAEPLGTVDNVANAVAGGAAGVGGGMLRAITQDPGYGRALNNYGQVFQHPGTAPYQILGGVGSLAMTAPAMLLGGAGMFAAGGVAGLGAGQAEIDRRVDLGERVMPQAQIGIPLGYAAAEGAAEAIGGRTTLKTVPKLIAPLRGVPRALGAVGLDVGINAAEEAATQVGQNALLQGMHATGAVSGPAPGLLEGAGDAALGGVGGGLALAPVSYVGARHEDRIAGARQATQLPDAHVVKDPSDARAAAAVRFIGQAVGRKVVFFESDKPGVNATFDDENIYVNARSPREALASLVLHEGLGHIAKDPEVQQKLGRLREDRRDAVEASSRQYADNLEGVDPDRAARLRENPERFAEEGMARFIEMAVRNDPEAVADIASRYPGLFGRLKQSVSETIDRITGSGEQGKRRMVREQLGLLDDVFDRAQRAESQILQREKRDRPEMLAKAGVDFQAPDPDQQRTVDFQSPDPDFKIQDARVERVTRKEIEQRLVANHEDKEAGYTAADESELSEFVNPFTFQGKLPDEVLHYLESNPAARRLFRTTDVVGEGNGADAFGKLGDRYFQIADKLAGAQLEQAKETAQHSEPEMQFLAKLHDTLPRHEDRVNSELVDPATLKLDMEGKINGMPARVTQDEDEETVLEFDGLQVPVSALSKPVPFDEGTLTLPVEPDVPDGDVFDQVAGEHEQPAPAPQPAALKPTPTPKGKWLTPTIPDLSNVPPGDREQLLRMLVPATELTDEVRQQAFSGKLGDVFDQVAAEHEAPAPARPTASPLEHLGGKRRIYRSGDREFVVDYIPHNSRPGASTSDLGDPHVAFITGVTSEGSGGDFADVIPKLVDDLRREGFRDIAYRPENEDGRGAARTRLFEGIRRQFSKGEDAPRGTLPTKENVDAGKDQVATGENPQTGVDAPQPSRPASGPADVQPVRNVDVAADAAVRDSARPDVPGEQLDAGVREPAGRSEVRSGATDGDVTPPAPGHNVSQSGPDATENAGSSRLADRIVEHLNDPAAATLDTPAAAKMARDAFGGTAGTGTFNMKDVADAVELGVNRWVRTQADIDATAPLEQAAATVGRLESALAKLPTQSWRTKESERFQQFSTPPHYSFAAAWVANIGPNDTLLEPSAGTGSLAVYGVKHAAHTIANELSPRRLELLKSLGVPEVHNENAEQIGKILAGKVKPTVVVMNPPFSQTAGRMGDKKDLFVAAKHIQEALDLLPDGGRLVAIVGRGMAFDAPTFKGWWQRTRNKYAVRANVGVAGAVYRKYGTAFATRLLVIDKIPPGVGNPVTGDVSNVVELMKLLQGVRDGRAPVDQRNPTQPGVQGKAPGGAADARPATPVLPSAGGMGDRGVGDRAGGEVPAGAAARGPDAGVAGRGDEVRPSAGDTGSGSRPGPADAGGSRAVAAGESGSGAQPDVALESAAPEAPRPKEELTNAVFEGYRPQRIRVAGAQPHPTKLVESAAMATVSPPAVTYTPRLPKPLIDQGKLSEAQLEAVVYAGAAHQEMLPPVKDETTGEDVEYRRGFFVGDGTGVGKGAEVAGILLDNWNQGRRRGIWVSKNYKLHSDALRDWSWVGKDKSTLLRMDKFKSGTKIEAAEGIMFVPYGTLKSGLGTPAKSRVQQLVDWLGPDFDGVIAFDEAHSMKGAIAQRGKRGTVEASQTGLAGVDLQKALPKARVVYVSATGATEVSNLGYASRLGLWGPGTPFDNANKFATDIHAGGLAAMELVARDMKASGAYLARQLSFDGTEQDRLTHSLTPEQSVIYDKLTEAWGVVLRNINEALELTAGQQSRSGEVKIDGKAKSAAMSAFWGTHQRFFNQVITSLKMPTILKDIEAEVGKGNAAVLQLVNTNEASSDRAIANLDEDDSLEDLDMTPRDALIEMVKKSFPVAQLEPYTDDNGNGNVRMRPVLDAAGNAVVNPQAVRMRDRLVEQLHSIRVPDGPLEMLLNHFGADQVAEVTGRSKRVVRVKDKDGSERTIIEPRSESKALADAASFQGGKKNILVFSKAGGTGASYHADKKAKNQRRRIHYLVQPGWIADDAMQGFGRTHRSGEVSQPVYRLTQTNLNGEKRFVSSIARRLDQLGAITRGQRQAANQGMFNELDNLESPMAQRALQRLVGDIAGGDVDWMSAADFETATGIVLMKEDKNGPRLEVPPMPKFLNRLLSLSIDKQNRLFDEFVTRYRQTLEIARSTGELDVGIEVFKADTIKKAKEQSVYADPRTGAETKLVTLDVGNRTQITPFGRVAGYSDVFFAKNEVSGQVAAFTPAGSKTDTDTGAIKTYYRRHGPTGSSLVEDQAIDRGKNWTRIEAPAAQPLWEKQAAKAPEFQKDQLHVLTGVILPIWDKIGGRVEVKRLQTDDGERLLGRVVDEDAVEGTLKALGKAAGAPTVAAAGGLRRVLDRGDTLELVGGWKVARKSVSGEPRVEIVGPNFSDYDSLRADGAQLEKQGYQTRVFIPDNDQGVATLGRVLARKPVERVRPGGKDDRPLAVAEVDESLGRRIADVVKPLLPSRERRASSSLAFEDPDVEKRYRAAQGAKRPSLLERLAEGVTSVKTEFTRHFRHLDTNKKPDAELANILRLREAAQQNAPARAKRDMETWVKGLTPTEFEGFGRLLILPDILKDIDAGRYDGGKSLPFGFKDREHVERELGRFRADAPEKVTAAVAARNEHVRDLTRRMVDLKLLKPDVLDDDRYYHRQVMEYLNLRERATIGGTGPDAKLHKRGFQRARVGGGDFNTAYEQSEHEYLTHAYRQIATAEALQRIEDRFDRSKALRQEAKRTNLVAAFGGEDNYAEFLRLRKDLKAAQAGGDRKAAAVIHESLDPLWVTHHEDTQIAKSVDALFTRAKETGTDDELDVDEFSGRAFDLAEHVLANPDRFEEGAVIAARWFLKSVADKQAKIHELAGDKFVTLEDIVPDDHTLWSPKAGTSYAHVLTVPERVVARMVDGVTQISEGEIREEFARVPGKQIVIPEHFAQQLDEQPRQPDGWLDQFAGAGMTSWKQWKLLNPMAALRYNLNNTSGDVDAAFAADPRILGGIKQAGKDLYAFGQGKGNRAEMERLMELGVIGSGESLHEIPDITDAGIFRKLTGGRGNPVNWYWDRVKGGTALRENVTRLATYRRAHELLGQGKNPLWASKPSELSAITDRQEKAAKLSRDLIGDYGNISVGGQVVRRRYIPFWSWHEINVPRYYRLFANAAAEGRTGRTGAAAATGVARVAAGLTLRASAMYMAVHLFNMAFFPDEDDGFEDGRLRLLVGTNEQGQVFGVRFQGAFSDALSWFGAEDLPGKVARLDRGEEDLSDIALDIAAAAPTKLINAALPIQKTLGEAATGKSLFPDPLNPRPIRDRGEHLARLVDLDPLYRTARGIPQAGVLEGAAGTVVQSSDPGQGAYHTIRGAAHEWLADQGIERGGGEPTDRSNALFYHRKALALGDDEKAEEWLEKYHELGGTEQGMKQSVRMAHPLALVPEAKRGDFVRSLSARQREQLRRAVEWYVKIYRGEAAVAGA